MKLNAFSEPRPSRLYLIPTNWLSRRRKATASTLSDDDPAEGWTVLRHFYGLDYTVEPRNGSIYDFYLNANELRELSSLRLVCNASMCTPGENQGIHRL